MDPRKLKNLRFLPDADLQRLNRCLQESAVYNHAEHVRNNCNCAFIIRFDDSMNAEGDDPDEMLERFDNAEGSF